jgi:predicted DCC family thiol-disulfide oxidoreductase YuxK
MINPDDLKYNIILFDGVCNFCNYWVNFILERDYKNQFKFSALQSLKGKELLEKFNLPADKFDSIILISNNKIFKKSEAAFKIAECLGGGWLRIFLLFKLLPASFNDFVYDLIANNRYKLFGKKDICRIPTSSEKGRFL